MSQLEEITLKEYIEQMIVHERELREQVLKENKTALDLANKHIESRLNGMNELREQINIERGKYIQREMFDKINEGMEKRLLNIELYSANIQGRIWAFAVIATGISTILAAIVSFLLKK